MANTDITATCNGSFSIILDPHLLRQSASFLSFNIFLKCASFIFTPAFSSCQTTNTTEGHPRRHFIKLAFKQWRTQDV